MKTHRLHTFLTLAALLGGGTLLASGCQRDRFRDDTVIERPGPGPLAPSDVDRTNGYGDRGPNGGIHNDRWGSDPRYRAPTTSDEKNPSPSGEGPRKLWGDDTGGSAPASEGK